MVLPYTEVEFDKKGRLTNPQQVGDAGELFDGEKATDVIVLTHGWNNDTATARALYRDIMSSLEGVRGKVARAKGRRFVVVGLIWPSILWAPPDHEGQGAGAGIGDEADELRELIEQQVEQPSRRDALIALIPSLETSASVRAEFVDLLRTDLPAGAVDDADPDSAPEALKTADAETLFAAAGGGPALSGAPEEAGGAAGLGAFEFGEEEGGAAGFSLSGLLGAARSIVNITTYYTMKERAGVVGAKGIAKLLEQLHATTPGVRLHLVGHSFGGRAVTAAADATNAPVSSMCLLQAAYSHYGMAQGWDGAQADGVFARVPGRVAGPIVVTFTRNDKAVGLAYPVASRIARQVGVGLGDANDKYGGIGRNGALKTPASLPFGTLLDVGGEYVFQPGRVSSLDGDRFISGHSDIAGRQVAYAVLTAATTVD